MRASKDRSAKPLLSDTLSVLLPTVEQTWLLRTCLNSGEVGANAWRIWQERVGDPKKALADDRLDVKWMLPLLYHALRRDGVVVDTALLPYLRTAYFREELRSQAFRQICQQVLAALVAAGIPLLVLNGTALADMVYGDWALRHCHALDVMVAAGELARAVRTLQAAGLSPGGGSPDARAGAVRLQHQSGVPVTLHRDLFPLPYYRAPLSEMWERSLAHRIAGNPVRVLAPADTLVHVCGQASCSRIRDKLEWVCDAWYVVNDGAHLDWDLLLDSTLRCHLALPLSVMLGYLVDELSAPIPAQVLQRLMAASVHAPVVAREAALSGARTGRHGTLKNLLSQTQSWLGWGIVLKWMVFPSPSCLRWTYAVRSRWLLPVYYLYRPLHYIARRVIGAFRRSAVHKRTV